MAEACHDVRNIEGRLAWIVIATFVGIACSLGVTLALPTRDHFPLPPGSCGFGHGTGFLVEGGSASLMIAGSVVFAVLAYAALGALCRTRR